MVFYLNLNKRDLFVLVIKLMFLFFFSKVNPETKTNKKIRKLLFQKLPKRRKRQEKMSFSQQNWHNHGHYDILELLRKCCSVFGLLIKI